MKIRNDFVSNSSSCSFVITGQMVSNAVKFFDKTFANVDIPSIGISVSFAVKNKFYNDVAIAFSKDPTNRLKDCDPEELCWDYIDISLDELVGSNRLMSILDKIEELRFECDDYDTLAVMNLSKMYDFFGRNGFEPDNSNSEMEFGTDDDSDFFHILRTTTM